jgi:hypothetical protein
MTERELDDAFDELFVGGRPPSTATEALARLPAETRTQIESDPESMRTLADLVWMTSALQSDVPLPADGFAKRATDAAYQVGEYAPKSRWTSFVGIGVAAALLFGIGVALWPKPAQNGNGPDIAKVDPKPTDGSSALSLFDQVTRFTPNLTGDQAMFSTLSRTDIAAMAVRRETGPLAKTIAAPAENLVAVGQKIEQEARPLRQSVRDAFAFLGDFPVQEKKSL